MELDILPAINGGDSLCRTAMPDRIGLRRLIQQSAYLSDSMRDGELPEISVPDSNCLMAKNIEIRLAPATMLAPGDSLYPQTTTVVTKTRQGVFQQQAVPA